MTKVIENVSSCALVLRLTLAYLIDCAAYDKVACHEALATSGHTVNLRYKLSTLPVNAAVVSLRGEVWLDGVVTVSVVFFSSSIFIFFAATIKLKNNKQAA